MSAPEPDASQQFEIISGLLDKRGRAHLPGRRWVDCTGWRLGVDAKRRKYFSVGLRGTGLSLTERI
jgi:hypothetical protein